MTVTIPVQFNNRPPLTYDIVIGVPLHRVAKNILRTLPASSYFVITDSNVASLYADEFTRVLGKSGPPVDLLVVKAGEASKVRRTKERLEDAVLSGGVDRDSIIIALGGGVVGDLGGFVAATLLRGIRYIQIPTTVLAQVDSSVGGKVAVNHPRGKNLLGAFHQPSRVYIDMRVVQTLPEEEFHSGLAEVIKFSAILDDNLFRRLEEHATLILARNVHSLQGIVERCCTLKRDVVQKDERDENARRILNFGHTLGHAIERVTRYKMKHGHAISVGMMYEGMLSVRLGLLPPADLDRLRSLLSLFHIPTQLPRGISLESVIRYTAQDKKRQGTKVAYTLLEGIGKATVGHTLTESKVRSLLLR